MINNDSIKKIVYPLNTRHIFISIMPYTRMYFNYFYAFLEIIRNT